MKKRTPLLLAVIILLPMLLLAWFGVRLQLDQQQVATHQFKNLVESRLQSIDQQLQGHFFSLQAHFIPQGEALYRETGGQYDAGRLRQFISRSAQVQQMFVLSAQGERVFPPRNLPLNRQEQSFVELTRSLLLTPERFTAPTTDPQVAPGAPSQQTVSSVSGDELYSGQLRSSSPSKSRYAPAADTLLQETELQESGLQESEPLQQDSPHGWIAWYAEAGLQHIFWWQDLEGNTLGFALNSARLLSDLINYLPDSSTTETEYKSAEMQLINNRDEVSYSWGGYQHNGQQKAVRILPLSHPLGSWRLAYYSAAQQPVVTSWLGLASLLLLLTAGLSTLAYLLYREHRRELRLAEQRVNFVNQVSHELKTPLTNVRLYAEMLENELSLEEEQSLSQRYLGVINSETQRLSRLIDNVLSFSRIKREGTTIRQQEGVVDDYLAQIIQTFTPAMTERGISVRFDGQATERCLFDAEALEQVINNLLSNCEKYAAAGQFIDICSWQQHVTEECYSYIRIRDYGPGINYVEAEAIFTPFYRISNKLTDGISGTGIGLGLARDLARAHGGDLILECPSDKVTADSGASFLLTLRTPLSETDGSPSQRSENPL
ncbi:sensor histidine kinase [Amphritea sp. HPY]|uniref:sensor histidine kinase n=1 Tax=Amphritea sp. HPY TaxID=3421652 RepID=UPI003D7DB8D2